MKITNDNNFSKSGVYKITNNLSGRFYFGSTNCFKTRYTRHKNLLKNKKHYNPKFQADFNKWLKKQNGNDDFLVFEIIEIVEGTREVRAVVEKKYIDKNWGPKCLNIRRETIQKEGPWSSTPEETRKKMSEAHKGKKISEEQKKILSIANKGKIRSEEMKKHLSEINKGKCHTEETKRRMSEAHKNCTGYWKGKHHSEETKKKIGKTLQGKFKGENHYNYGKHLSEETKKKISENNAKLSGKDHPMYNKHHSEETKRKMREAHKNRKPISEETRQKMSEASKGHTRTRGRKLSVKHCKNISKALKGRKFSEEHKQKISKTKMGKKRKSDKQND